MKKLLTVIAAIAAAAQITAAPNPRGVVNFSYPERDIYSIQDVRMTKPGTLFRSVLPQAKFRPGK